MLDNMTAHEPTDENRCLISTLCGIGVSQKMTDVVARAVIDQWLQPKNP